MAFAEEVHATLARASQAGVDRGLCDALAAALGTALELTAHLGSLGLAGDIDGMLLHSADYLELFSIVAVAWQWMAHAAAAKEARKPGSEAFYAGKLAAARYWIHTELPRVQQLAALCRSGEDSYARLGVESF
jgi:hypothetical protein